MASRTRLRSAAASPEEQREQEQLRDLEGRLRAGELTLAECHRAIVCLLLERLAGFPPELEEELAACLHETVEENAYFEYAREVHARSKR